jgi:hypothetical protein
MFIFSLFMVCFFLVFTWSCLCFSYVFWRPRLHGCPHQNWVFFFEFWSDLPPHFQGFWSQWWRNPTIIYHHLQDMGGYEISGGPDRWGRKGLIIICVESFEVTYPPFSSVLKLLVKLFWPKNIGFGGYWRFGVFGLHGHLDSIVILFLGFGGFRV